MVLINNEVMSAGASQTDPHSHPVPLETILSKEYARIRFKLLQMSGPRDSVPAPPPGSTHVTVVDGAGNVATILHSCMALPWSNGLFVEGISICAVGGHFLPVMPGPGDRASAYVAPNIIFKNGKPVLASGSPSVSLIANILQNTVNRWISASPSRNRYTGPDLAPPIRIRGSIWWKRIWIRRSTRKLRSMET
jgi:gamma-glutamyltranspeptidase/glutathione hydrolase